MTHTKRTVSWSVDGFRWKADNSHGEKVIQLRTAWLYKVVVRSNAYCSIYFKERTLFRQDDTFAGQRFRQVFVMSMFVFGGVPSTQVYAQTMIFAQFDAGWNKLIPSMFTALFRDVLRLCCKRAVARTLIF